MIWAWPELRYRIVTDNLIAYFWEPPKVGSYEALIENGEIITF